MHAIPDSIRKCVVFLYYRSKENGEKLAGTAFFVSVPSTDNSERFIYLVTAKHVIAGIQSAATDGKILIRINTKNNSQIGSVGVESEISNWIFHPNDTSVDTALLIWAPRPEEFDYRAVPSTMAVTEEVILEEGIGAGDEVFLTGLFRHHYGKERNLPIIRTGNIALMPEEKLHTMSFGMIDAYLVEARSLSGLSGSPVFAFLGNLRAKKQSLYWLGLMHGHWDTNEAKIDSESDNKNGRSINVGIGIVVPAAKIMEIINSDELVQKRKDGENNTETHEAK